MTYCIGVLTSNSVCIVGDRFLTLEKHNENPSLATNFKMETCDSSEKGIKVFSIDNIIFSFAGKIKFPLEIYKVLLGSSNLKLNPKLAIERAINSCGPFNNPNDCFELLLGFLDPNPCLFHYSSLDNRLKRCYHIESIGNMPKEKHKEVVNLIESKLLNYPAIELAAIIIAIVQSVINNEDLDSKGIGGAAHGIYLDTAGVIGQPDILFTYENTGTTSVFYRKTHYYIFSSTPTDHYIQAPIMNSHNGQTHKDILENKQDIVHEVVRTYSECQYDFVIYFNTKGGVSILKTHKVNSGNDHKITILKKDEIKLEFSDYFLEIMNKVKKRELISLTCPRTPLPDDLKWYVSLYLCNKDNLYTPNDLGEMCLPIECDKKSERMINALDMFDIKANSEGLYSGKEILSNLKKIEIIQDGTNEIQD